MLPEVEAYFGNGDTTDAAVNAYRQAQRELDIEYNRGDMTPNQLRTRQQEQRAVYDAAVAANLAGLTNSSDPLVKWIAENTLSSNRDYSRMILQALPASEEDLDAIASEAGMCSDYNRFKRAAMAAGVMSHLPQSDPAYRDLKDYCRNQLGGDYQRQVLTRVRTLVAAKVAEALAAKAAEEAAAKEARAKARADRAAAKAAAEAISVQAAQMPTLAAEDVFA